MNWKIPLFDLKLTVEEESRVLEVIRSGWLTMGEVTKEFERNFAKFINVKYAFATSNCTAALHLANLVLGIGPQDEVIVPSLTFVATVNSILYVKAKPVFADCESLDNFNISVEDIARKVTPKTKAVIVVHYGGYPCDMKQILEICKERNLALIEDCAHAPGAEYNGRKVGTFGDLACFSFFSNKNMTTGEGGMLVTNNDSFAEKIKLLRSHGMTTLTLDRFKGYAYQYDVLDLGYNYRIDEMRAALGICQLKKLKENNTKRKKIVELYKELLKGEEKIKIPFRSYEGRSAFHIFPIILDKTINRVNLIRRLNNDGIQVSIHYPPVHKFSYYKKKYPDVKLPNTEFIGEHELTLPLYPHLKEEDVNFIVEHIKKSI